MARPKIADHIVQAVLDLWAKDVDRLSATAIYRQYRQKAGRGLISERKVQQIIAEAKRKRRESDSFPTIEWIPWQDLLESSESSDYLLRLDATSVATYKRHLYKHEAEWAIRLRAAMYGLSIRAQLSVIQEYGRRATLAWFLGGSPETADLDGLIAYKPWIPSNYEVYHWAVLTEAIPPLPATAFPDQSDTEGYWKMVLGEAADPGLPVLNQLGRSSGTWYLTGLRFEPRMSSSYDPAQPRSEDPGDVVEWLQLKLQEFWLGQSDSKGLNDQAAQEVQNERINTQTRPE